jgi:hypothetical protein
MLRTIIDITVGHLPFTLAAALCFCCAKIFADSKRQLFATALMLTGVVALVSGMGLIDWLTKLGDDSFFEALDFGLNDARFWIFSLTSLISEVSTRPSKTLAFVSAQSLLLAAALYWLSVRQPRLKKIYGVVFVCAISTLSVLISTGVIRARSFIADLERDYSAPPSGFRSTALGISLFVYIGESTSTLNMRLYGYPLNTTPNLSAMKGTPGFIVFEGVRSTHTHTSASLLRALTVTATGRDDSIVKWGIGDVLAKSGQTATLFTAQPRSGSFNAVGKYIFGDISNTDTLRDRRRGAKDHEILEYALEKPGVVFFHSYAGHGPYQDYVDGSLSSQVPGPDIGFTGVYGRALSRINERAVSANRAAYDRAVTYIDRNVSHAIATVADREEPAALVYFSDHGEAVYANRGHDSSRYLDEMSTVPLIVFFNEAYRRRFSSTVGRLEDASRLSRLRLLDQVTPTILEILQIEPSLRLDVPSLSSIALHPRPYILERTDLLGRRTRISLEYRGDYSGSIPSDKSTSISTEIAVINARFRDKNAVCYHRANSFAKALRAASITDCLEVDLVVNGQSFDIYHPPLEPTGFRLEHVFDILSGRNKKLWIDAKNLNDERACSALHGYLTNRVSLLGEILVEFPPNSVDDDGKIFPCARALRGLGVRTSFYVPSEPLMECASSRAERRQACSVVSDVVRNAIDSGAFSDISYSLGGHPVILGLPEARQVRWNTWGVSARQFSRLPRDDFDYIILDTEWDPNSY